MTEQEAVSPLHQAIGQEIRRRRKMLGLRGFQLAELSNVSAVHISHIENGRRNVSVGMLEQICTALETSVAGLFYQALSTEEQLALAAPVVTAQVAQTVELLLTNRLTHAQ